MNLLTCEQADCLNALMTMLLCGVALGVIGTLAWQSALRSQQDDDE